MLVVAADGLDAMPASARVLSRLQEPVVVYVCSVPRLPEHDVCSVLSVSDGDLAAPYGVKKRYALETSSEIILN